MAKVETIAVSTKTGDNLRRMVEAGNYASADDVIRAGLEALAEKAAAEADDLAWVKARIRASVDDTRPGYSSEEVRRHIDELLIRAEGRRRDSAA
ncbi:MAG: hypothetical protein M9939_21120 [Mesorhizobium sp.]|nr:hypothetical protein [Mesorhizobium sp.]MCO5163636.1 hypothetical protein [Mesorhizobium sp.]